MAASSQQTLPTRALRDADLIDGSGAWAKEARLMASDRAQAAGLPQRRDEYWKYTRPDAFVQADVTLQASLRSSLGLFDQRNTISVTFEDGKIQAAALPNAAQCTLESLASTSAPTSSVVKHANSQRVGQCAFPLNCLRHLCKSQNP